MNNKKNKKSIKFQELLKKTVTILSVLVVFLTSYFLVLPAVTIDRQTADEEGGIVIEKKESDEKEELELSDPDYDDDTLIFDDQENSVTESSEPEIIENKTETSELDNSEILSYPEQTLEGYLEDTLVIVYAPEGSLPEGAQMILEEINANNELISSVNDTLSEKKVDQIKAIDISFVYNEEKVEPRLPVQVNITSSFIQENSEDALLYHVSDNGNVDQIEANIPDASQLETVSDEHKQVLEDIEKIEQINTDNTLSFKADSFSVYLIVYTSNFEYEGYSYTLESGRKLELFELFESLHIDRSIESVKEVYFSNTDYVSVQKNTLGTDWIIEGLEPFASIETLTVVFNDNDQIIIKVSDSKMKRELLVSNGKSYSITLNYGTEALLPEDADLEVRELIKGSEEYSDHLYKAAKALDIDPSFISFSRFFDIQIVKDGENYEPEDTVNVEISLSNAPEQIAELDVVHFKEDETELLGSDVYKSDEGGETNVTFDADSFSVYGVIVSDTGASSVNDLDGRSMKIGVSGYYLATNNTGDTNPRRISKTNDPGRAGVWYFEKVDDNGSYHIYTEQSGTKQYINLGYCDSYNAHAFLSDTAQALKVNRNADGTFTIGANLNGRNYYLNQYNGVDGNGFAGWLDGNDGNSKLSFTQSVLQNNKEYMTLAKIGDEYYIINNDGSLTKVNYHNGTVNVDEPMLWTYTGSNLYHHSIQVAYNDQQLPTDFYYRYIDPNADTGLNDDTTENTTLSPDGKTVINRELMASAAFDYVDHKLRSKTNQSNYVGIKEINGKLYLKGQVSEEEAVTIVFADPVNVDRVNWTMHSVNHIDISIEGSAEADVPLAYGKYYDSEGNLVFDVKTFKKIHLGAAQVDDPEQLVINTDDMKRATITAYTKDSQGKAVPLNDAFYISGYSANEKTGISADQVRVEGSYKVADLDYVVNAGRYSSDENYRNQVHRDRLNNRIYYSVTVMKPVTFNLVDPDSGKQLYDDMNNPLKITADVSFSASFDYWDPRNECPPLVDPAYGYTDKWPTGGIPDHNMSGMDFVLCGDAEDPNTKVYAIEITKIIVDENGNRIRSYNAGTSSFKIFKSDTISPDDLKEINIGAPGDIIDYEPYQELHSKAISIGKEGIGLIYDYDVSPGVYYISEDPSSIENIITDTSGKEWDYKETYFYTEYAWRDHPNDNYMHVSDTYTNKAGKYASVPEVLGDHPSYYDPSVIYTNDFLEFYVYNVYESPKVNVPVEKNWKDFQSEQFDWSATFKLQWASIYPDGTVSNFQDVDPLQTMTITKDQMAHPEESLPDRTFNNLPKYGTDQEGHTFRYQYSLEETSYVVTNSVTGEILYSWDDQYGYNNDDEDTHYQPFYPHDAGESDPNKSEEENASDENYYIVVSNAKKNIRQKEYIDISLKKLWDESFVLGENSYAEFELIRFKRTEYRDISHMSDADRLASPVTVTIVMNGETIDSLSVQPNVGLYLGAYFKAHEDTVSASFESNHPVSTLGGETSSLSATATGQNMSNAIVRSQEFFVTQDTVFTITNGMDSLVDADRNARVLDTSYGASALPDSSFHQTIRLNNQNSWKTELTDLLYSETSAGADDDNENVVLYEYYLVEKSSEPDGYARFYRMTASGQASEILSGDVDHRIETDEKIVAVNSPPNRLIVEKVWRGIPDTTGFPLMKFTLYQGWLQGDHVSPNGGESWVYENESGIKYEHIELPGNSLTWVCPEDLPTTKTDGGNSRPVGYYVLEDEKEGSLTEEDITTSWRFYYYLNSNGSQKNVFEQGAFTGLSGSSIADHGGTLTICNRLDQYRNLDIQKQFFKLKTDGAWDNVTSSAEMRRDVVLGFKVIRAIKTSDGKWMDETGTEVNDPVWMDYGNEMLCGYDGNGNPVLQSDQENKFFLEYAGGDWHFRIRNNDGDASDVHAGGSGLPIYGYYVRNGEDIPVEYWYSFRETNVYKDLNKTPYPEWDWFSSITPVKAYGTGEMEAFPKVFHGQDPARIANFQASDLEIDKEWTNDVSTAKEIYIKIWRTTGNGDIEDFTKTIATDIRENNNWQLYVFDTDIIDTNREWLIIRPDENGDWTATMKVNRALLGVLNETGIYHYYIQEVAYKSLTGEIRTNVEGKYHPVYSKWVDDDWQAPSADFAGNSITIGEKGGNKLKVINTAVSATSYGVTKRFIGTQVSTGGQSSVNGYPNDGSKQVIVELQQRYRYEKKIDGVDCVSKDNVEWVPADSEEAKNIWINPEWQAADISDATIVLPLKRPLNSTVTDAEWYASEAAWTYVWEGLPYEKVISEAPDPRDSLIAQLYYRAVETSTPGWYNYSISEVDADGHKAVDDDKQTSEQILSERNDVLNTQGRCDLNLNKQWTGLGEGENWPEGYTVDYQLIQEYHLTNVIEGESGLVYSFDKENTIRTVRMVRAYTDGMSADNVHTQAMRTLDNANVTTIADLPTFGYMTATADDVLKASEYGIELQIGIKYPVVYTYSVEETSVKKNGTEVEFTPQTVQAELDPSIEKQPTYKATLINDLPSLDLSILKVDNSDAEIALDGAAFELNEIIYNSDTKKISYKDGTQKTVTTSDGGTAVFASLSPGCYEIKEVSAPNGYIITDNDRFYVRVTDEIEMIKETKETDPHEWESITKFKNVSFEAESNTATVANTPGAELPSTGGQGPLVYRIIGTLVIILVCILRQFLKETHLHQL